MVRGIVRSAPHDLGAAIDRAVEALAPEAVELLVALVRVPSTLGREAGVQDALAAAFERLSFDIDRLHIPVSIGTDPAAGVPSSGYDDRHNLVAFRGDGGGPRILLNGHVDVVPADEPHRWASDPFEPDIRDGWLYGRGAGDMKGGFAMGWLAIAALDRAIPGWQRGCLSVLAALEEECTGNGTLAAAQAGVLGDLVVLLEPTDLRLLLGGIGILWFEIEVVGRGAHAESADRAVNPIDVLLDLIVGLRAWEADLNSDVADPLLVSTSHPYNLNLGTFHAGDWPSSVPSSATLGCRLGFPRVWSPVEAESRVRDVIASVASRNEWLRERPPVVRLTGLRAAGHALAADAPLSLAMTAAHLAAHGHIPPAVVLATTTDARIYLNDFGIPAICYGPRTRAIHAIDEAVELGSIVDGARTLARFLHGQQDMPRGREDHAGKS